MSCSLASEEWRECSTKRRSANAKATKSWVNERAEEGRNGKCSMEKEEQEEGRTLTNIGQVGGRTDKKAGQVEPGGK